ncbi:MAG: hypothetical protein JO148_13345 [Acidimicrobiia bacterium]|nr:hypothetical protein [Acidimicrobiia bacterium]
MSEESLVDEAQQAIGDGEKVLAAGVFQPRGTEGSIDVGGVAGAVVGGTVMSETQQVPRWTLIAVTQDRLHAFEAHGKGTSWSVGDPFETWERPKIAITVHGRFGVRTFTVEDIETGRHFEFETPRFGPAHGTVVLKLLQQEE